MLGTLHKWWKKRQKEKKRLALLALVRQVREEQGDYDFVSPVKRRRQQHVRGRRLVRDEGRPARSRVRP